MKTSPVVVSQIGEQVAARFDGLVKGLQTFQRFVEMLKHFAGDENVARE